MEGDVDHLKLASFFETIWRTRVIETAEIARHETKGRDVTNL